MKKIGKVFLMSVLLILIQLLVGKIPIQSYLYKMVFSGGAVVFLCAPVVFLFMRGDMPRWGFAAYSALAALVYAFMGYWYVAIYIIVIGIIGCLLLNHDNKHILVGWTVYSALFPGISILPVWGFWADYSAKASASGMTMEHLDVYFTYYSNILMVALVVVVSAAFGFAGIRISQTLFNRNNNRQKEGI